VRFELLKAATIKKSVFQNVMPVTRYIFAGVLEKPDVPIFTIVFCVLRKGATYSSETSFTVCQTSWYHNPENYILYG